MYIHIHIHVYIYIHMMRIDSTRCIHTVVTKAMRIQANPLLIPPILHLALPPLPARLAIPILV